MDRTDRAVAAARSFPPLAVLCLLSVPVPALCRSTAREEAELLARAGEARFRLAVLRRSGGRSAGAELAEATRSLEEALDLDPANLRALAFLGLARLESARPGPANPGPFDLAPAREPLDEFLKLATGSPAQTARALLQDVAAALDGALGGPAGDLAAWQIASGLWWQSWRERVTAAAETKLPPTDVVALLEDLRSAPYAWQRERAVERLAESEAEGGEVAQALAEALRDDPSPWVRAAAGRAFAGLRPRGWDVRLAEALRNDESAWVRRTCAMSLASNGAGEPGEGTLRPAALEALKAALAKDTPRVAAAAAYSLGAYGVERELVSALASRSAVVREAAVLALGGLDSKEIKAQLRPLLEDFDDRVRFAATCTYALTGDTWIVDQLRSFRESTVPLGGDHHSGSGTIGEAAGRLLDTFEKARP
jgi:HEAT repeat protein